MTPAPLRLKVPCVDCPFRKDKAYLSRASAVAIVERVIKRGENFHCHKTVDYTDAFENNGQGRVDPNFSKLCAGSLILTLKERAGGRSAHMPPITQIAERLGMWSPDELAGRDLIHDSVVEFIEAQESR